MHCSITDEKSDMRWEPIVEELIHELCMLSIDELEEVREEGIGQLKEEGISELVIDLAGYLTDLVIIKKGEKMLE